MDQLPFEFKFDLAGKDVDHFINMLKINGYHNQAKVATQQFNKQLENL